MYDLQALEECQIASDYLKNYQKAVSTIHRCAQENEKFAELSKVRPKHRISFRKNKEGNIMMFLCISDTFGRQNHSENLLF